MLAWTGVDAREAALSKTTSFRRILLLIVAAESWHALHFPAYQHDVALHVAIACALSACAAAGFVPRIERLATTFAFLGLAADLASVFPNNANHQYLGLACLGLLLVPRSGEGAEHRLILQALRWLIPIGFFWAGVQKVFHGYYFGGEFLAVRIATDSSFATVLEPFLSGGEFQRLSTLVPGRGAGPYRVDEPLFLLLSNGAWLAELTLAPLLLFRQTRMLAVLGVVVFMFGIELGAREIFFGMMMVSLALLYPERDVNRLALPLFGAGIAILMATSAGWLPSWSFG
jgi:hypothetical protein